jgi:hypothetical protein
VSSSLTRVKVQCQKVEVARPMSNGHMSKVKVVRSRSKGQRHVSGVGYEHRTRVKVQGQEVKVRKSRSIVQGQKVICRRSRSFFQGQKVKLDVSGLCL